MFLYLAYLFTVGQKIVLYQAKKKIKIEKNKKGCCLVNPLSNIKFRLNEAYQIRIIYLVD